MNTVFVCLVSFISHHWVSVHYPITESLATSSGSQFHIFFPLWEKWLAIQACCNHKGYLHNRFVLGVSKNSLNAISVHLCLWSTWPTMYKTIQGQCYPVFFKYNLESCLTASRLCSAECSWLLNSEYINMPRALGGGHDRSRSSPLLYSITINNVCFLLC